jgi:hypothetical protein
LPINVLHSCLIIIIINAQLGLLANGYVLKKSASCGPEAMPVEQQHHHQHHQQMTVTKNIQQQQQQQQPNVSAYEYDEIDQIYDYIRGLASLPKNLNNFESLSETSPIHSGGNNNNNNNSNSKLPHSQKCTAVDMRQSSGSGKVVNSPRYSSPQDSSLHKRENHHHHHHNHHHNLFNSDSWIKHELLEKPIPPTIKTIPSKKQLTQKRPTLIFARTNSSSHGPKISSSSSPNQKDSSSAELSPQSPLFHIR